ncbi:hypothetical protein BV25DRAFT_1830931 [Artomyces pyxidatus]|uniref:Uncharacterized protein n=1 Tax=Artomyces pyxidatus TaxID=48021 RepID=A0ACB8SNK8_9AGAM|nr:hypothetical protein BV25DRAFT_1830931 [Artomyces pyxidatus]
MAQRPRVRLGPFVIQVHQWIQPETATLHIVGQMRGSEANSESEYCVEDVARTPHAVRHSPLVSETKRAAIHSVVQPCKQLWSRGYRVQLMSYLHRKYVPQTGAHSDEQRHYTAGRPSLDRTTQPRLQSRGSRFFGKKVPIDLNSKKSTQIFGRPMLILTGRPEARLRGHRCDGRCNLRELSIRKSL